MTRFPDSIVIAIIIISYMIFAFALVSFGPTFGNRCAKFYDTNSMDWEKCVHRLENGGTIFTEEE